jgi:cinnamoyl-CoA reductase
VLIFVLTADSKNAHLLALEGAKERLTLCRAEVLDFDSLRAAFTGCHGVFHVASPVSNDPVSFPKPPLLLRHSGRASAAIC